MTDEQPPEDLGHAGAVVDKAIEYMVGQNIGALSIASVIFVILDLDTPFSGLFMVSSQPMRDALAHLNR